MELPSVYAEAIGLDISFPETFQEIKKSEEELLEFRKRYRWIPVSERLPEEDVLIFMFSRIEGYQVGFYGKLKAGCGMESKGNHFQTREGWASIAVEKWMEILPVDLTQ